MNKNVVIGVLLAAFSSNALAETASPGSPMVVLARSAGAFVGATEYIRAFKASDCGYALKKSFPSYDALFQSEVLSSFPPTYRDEVVRGMKVSKPEVSRQANEYVQGMITAAKKDHDHRTACGLIAATIAGVYSNAQEKWLSNKASYGWKGN